MKANYIRLAVLILILLSVRGQGYAQDKPIKLRIFTSLHTQLEEHKVEEASGYGIGAQMGFALTSKLDVKLGILHDHHYLTQQNVLDIWEWDYWEDTYIDFLPGTEPEIVNKTLNYTSTDSIYSAVFNPTQSLKELRLFTGLQYNQPITSKFVAYMGFDAGFSLFFRELKMEEQWTKRFKIDSLSTEKFDYEYNYDLLHFAPSKKGTTLFLSPFLGAKYDLSSSLDLDVGFHYVQYIKRKELAGLKLSNAAEKWFPMQSKIQIVVGLTFKY
ncbi:hypothetical protein JXB12_03620 [candidate division KSB1 bacterium]|nr:hypothetical protein [candidate division KSB1 bacterium]